MQIRLKPVNHGPEAQSQNMLPLHLRQALIQCGQIRSVLRESWRGQLRQAPGRVRKLLDINQTQGLAGNPGQQQGGMLVVYPRALQY